MATDTIQLRPESAGIRRENVGRGFASALALHGAVAGLLVAWAYYIHSFKNWGDLSAVSGTIQATMVSAIPLPPKQPMNADNVLATDLPSPAPIQPSPHTVETPKENALDIPLKTAKVTTADKNSPPPPLHPQPIKVDPNKVQTGEAPGVKIAMSSTETKLGTFSVGVTDNAFGTRFAFYIEQINRSLAKEWYVGMLDAQATGRRVYITFQIARDGTPSHIKMEQTSGDVTLDRTAMSAVQHVETFGPLPDAYQGDFVNVQYYFEAPPRQ